MELPITAEFCTIGYGDLLKGWVWDLALQTTKWALAPLGYRLLGCPASPFLL